MEQHKSLVEITSSKIIDFIKEKNLDIGDKLPNEYELLEVVGVGRSTLREAIKMLVSKNVLEVRHGAGTFVSKQKGIADDPFGFGMIKDQNKMTADLFELRFLLEPTMAAMAAQHATVEQINKLKYLQKELKRLIREGDDTHILVDMEFHTTIAEASGNIALSHIVPIINQSIGLYNSNNEPKDPKGSIDFHDEILAAIEARDPVYAMDAMTVHMAMNRNKMKKKKSL
ncbi:FadR/GntR family transcriptional regulator [Enterococcus sp. DIV0876]|uniref:FadR/GntR family transcriptional regulator n=1 Tax=Enterococcus sp. DIV0876 TaxID=2774633 RepID=UPI003D2FA450